MSIDTYFKSAQPVPVVGQQRLAVGQVYLQPVEGEAGPRLWQVTDVELSTPVAAFMFELTHSEHPAPTEINRHWVLLDFDGLALVLDMVAAYHRTAPMSPEQQTYIGRSVEFHAFAEEALSRQRIRQPEPEPEEPPALRAIDGGGEHHPVTGQQTIELQMAVTSLQGAGKLLEASGSDSTFDAAINYVKAWSILQSLTSEMAKSLLDVGGANDPTA